MIWIDTNHDGISQPEELHKLDDMGIHSISLEYKTTWVIDAFGNEFRYKGRFNPDVADNVDRIVYDVILTTVE